ncbi:MAG: energy-coupling factor transporter transmembrane protein EcfT [Clostridia bacterium]|nr:energy-coupling factor transporter transmembrane protein EcfT [Clostridia bacterium]
MLKNITLGQYFPADTPIHRLDPRTKIILALVLLITVFVVRSFLGFAVFAVFILIAAGMARVKLRVLMRSVGPLLFIIILTFILNIFFSTAPIELRRFDILQLPADHVEITDQTVTVPADWYLVSWGALKISAAGLIRALFIAIRLTLLIMATSLLTLTTSPMQLTDGLEGLLSPLAKLHFPVHEMAMMMSIAMRFIPTLIDETDRIMKAQTARGADFDSGNIFRKAKNMVPLLVPLFVSAFKRADELALAMEARCYRGGEGRTRLHQPRMHAGDIVALIITLALCTALMIWL